MSIEEFGKQGVHVKDSPLQALATNGAREKMVEESQGLLANLSNIKLASADYLPNVQLISRSDNSSNDEEDSSKRRLLKNNDIVIDQDGTQYRVVRAGDMVEGAEQQSTSMVERLYAPPIEIPAPPPWTDPL